MPGTSIRPSASVATTKSAPQRTFWSHGYRFLRHVYCQVCGATSMRQAHELWICWVASQAYDEGSIPFTRSSNRATSSVSPLRNFHSLTSSRSTCRALSAFPVVCQTRQTKVSSGYVPAFRVGPPIQSGHRSSASASLRQSP